MTYALIQNNAVVAYPYTVSEFRAQNPNVSLPQNPKPAQLEEVGIFPVEPTQIPQYNPMTQNCTEGTPVLTNGVWKQVWVVTDATPEEILVRETDAKNANKQKAASLLTQTDWTSIADIGNPNISNPYLANVQEFIAYRNEVRSIAIDPPVETPVWPVMPTEVWVKK